jgi:hypothetical protein
MRASDWNLDTTSKHDDDNDFVLPESPEDLGDRSGIRLSLLILCVALFIAAMWYISRPSFEKCSALESVAKRNVCYDELRNELLKPPAKGGRML